LGRPGPEGENLEAVSFTSAGALIHDALRRGVQDTVVRVRPHDSSSSCCAPSSCAWPQASPRRWLCASPHRFEKVRSSQRVVSRPSRWAGPTPTIRWAELGGRRTKRRRWVSEKRRVWRGDTVRGQAVADGAQNGVCRCGERGTMTLGVEERRGQQGGTMGEGSPTTAFSGPEPRLSCRRRGRMDRCAVPAADAERWADNRRLRGRTLDGGENCCWGEKQSRRALTMASPGSVTGVWATG
jgi:hypothetical protein